VTVTAAVIGDSDRRWGDEAIIDVKCALERNGHLTRYDWYVIIISCTIYFAFVVCHRKSNRSTSVVLQKVSYFYFRITKNLHAVSTSVYAYESRSILVK
jgi:hypothetical protein